MIIKETTTCPTTGQFAVVWLYSYEDEPPKIWSQDFIWEGESMYSIDGDGEQDGIPCTPESYPWQHHDVEAKFFILEEKLS